MKTLTHFATVLALSLTCTAFGQGYFLFGATKSIAFENRGGGLTAGGADMSVAFMFALSGTPAVGSVGSPINDLARASWPQILSDPNFSWAINSATGQLVVQSCNGAGGWYYNGGLSFPVAGTGAGFSYQVYVVAWWNFGGIVSTPWQAAAAGLPPGWSNVFTYQTGGNSGSSILSFQSSGIQPFGIYIPEPSSLTLLAALSGVSWLRSRRNMRKRFP